MLAGGRATGWARGDEVPTNPNQTPNTRLMDLGRQSPSDNVRRREGKNPEPQLRSRSGRSVQRRMCPYCDNWEVGLEAAIPLKSA
jgi:hypothetical protein